MSLSAAPRCSALLASSPDFPMSTQAVPRPDFAYDVFLSYKSEDRPAVSMLRDALVRFGLRVFMDDQLRAGSLVSVALAEEIARSETVVIIFGPTVGEFQWDEMIQAIHHEGGPLGTAFRRRVIPVILPKGPAPAKLPRIIQPLGRIT